MSENTKIEWADMTFNPWRGCEKVSPGCKFCYAERMAKRNPAVLGQWGPGRISVRGKESYLALPRKWNALADQGRFRQCAVCGKREFRKWDRTIPPGGLSCCSNRDCVSLPETESNIVRPRVFCLSFGDWLDEHVPLGWLVELMDTIRTTPHLDWLLLTKRPGNFHRRLQKVFEATNEEVDYFVWDWFYHGKAPANVWVGTSVEDQIRADERIPLLLHIAAHRRFLSCEPLLEPISLHFDLTGIDWVIVGGESEAMVKARPFALEWALDLGFQCKRAKVPFFVKQLGSNPYVENANLWDWPLNESLYYQGPPPPGVEALAASGVKLQHPKGGNFYEFPSQIRIREFPKD